MTATGPHLLFVPDLRAPRLFLWGSAADTVCLASAGAPATQRCVIDTRQTLSLPGTSIALAAALPALAALKVHDAARLPASLASWSMAAKFALDLIARGRVIPVCELHDDRSEARWRTSLALPDDAERFAALANSLPPAAHAVPIEHATPRSRARNALAASQVWAPDALLQRFLDSCADLLMRSAGQQRAANVKERAKPASWELRLRRSLLAEDPSFTAEGFAERSLLEDLRTWIKPLAGTRRGEARACFRLDLPEQDESASPDIATAAEAFTLRFLLQSAADPSVLIPAADVYRGSSAVRRGIAGTARAAQERLLADLAIAARLFPAIGMSLHEARPDHLQLRSSQAWDFLNQAAMQLMEAGLGVILPAELTRSGQRRLRMRMRVGTERTSTAGDAVSEVGLDGVLNFRWQAELAGETLSEADLRELAKIKAPLIRYRGRWVAVDRAEIAEALRLLGQQSGTLAKAEGIAAALGVPTQAVATLLPVEVTAEGSFADVLARLREAAVTSEFIPPATFSGTLRPYQNRGVMWLATMAELGFGACLADDMGLGKTVQLIVLLLHRQREHAQAPALLVCPTSVVGNWERELQRFAPSLPVLRHYGSDRARAVDAFTALAPNTVVLTTYGLLRRDLEALTQVQWSVAVLDEAQNIKNAASRTAQSARALQATIRVAMTGTPVENRLAELWSISEFLNPRLLGSQTDFRRQYAIPIERYGQPDAAERLRRITQPFILRRLKSDPTIIQDLPPKQEMKVICSLTREQASLYQAALDEAMRRIEESDGIERRGQVLALLTALKQICNHPAQYLHEAGPLRGRSGKLQRSLEMLEEILDNGDRVLVFTQYREMGDRLVAEFERVFGVSAPFLHGGVPRAKRDEMVRAFQEDANSPPIFVLSVKAGGTGLNLTAASHVLHYDRWWNPAVEDQATDRAYRIGQNRAVQVHKLLCAGTVEDKVDQLLERKRDLAARIVGAGEQWITELSDDALRDLFSLAPDAVIADATDLEPAEESAIEAPVRGPARGNGRRKRARASA